MNRLHEVLIRENAELLERAHTHPFMLQVANGTIPEDRFLIWLAQNYLWTRDFERFLSGLSARAPRVLGKSFCEALLNLHGEIELYEEICARLEADVRNARHSYASSAFGNFLLATISVGSFEESLVACYSCNATFHKAWLHANREKEQTGPWQEVVELWINPGFTQWIDKVAEFVDLVSQNASDSTCAEMKEIFPIAIHYGLRHWDSGLRGEPW